jgi:Protein of unknown function (DUF3467)
MAHDNEADGAEKTVRIVLADPDTTRSRYATNLVVRHTEHEFVLSFFDVRPPLFYGPPTMKQGQLENVEEIVTACHTRIVIAASRMQSFVKALQDNLKTHAALMAEKETK